MLSCGSSCFLYHFMLLLMCSAGVGKWFLRCGIVWLCCRSAFICIGARLKSLGREVMMAAWILSCSGYVFASLACIEIVRCGESWWSLCLLISLCIWRSVPCNNLVALASSGIHV